MKDLSQMKRIRLIPILTVQEGSLVKTVKFKKPNYIGDPLNAIKILNDKEVDELLILDINVSANNQNPDFELIKEMASECFMPLGYGGGIKNLDIAQKIFNLGVEKIILNSSLMAGFDILKDISKVYGSQSVVVCIDIKKTFFGKNKVCFLKGREIINIDILTFALKCQYHGAGEIIIQDIDRDGTFLGLNHQLIKLISSKLSIPLVASGGLSDYNDMIKSVNAGASAIAGGSFFVYKNKNTQSILINYPNQKDLESNFYNKII